MPKDTDTDIFACTMDRNAFLNAAKEIAIREAKPASRAIALRKGLEDNVKTFAKKCPHTSFRLNKDYRTIPA